MKLSEIVEKLDLQVRTETGDLDVDVTGVYTSDMLSDVLANSEENNLWITLQTHPNIVAIASMKGLAGIVLINSRQPEEETVAKAQEKGIPLAHLALAWTLRQPAMTSLVVGVTKRAQIEAAVAASHLELTDAELTRIDALCPPPWGNRTPFARC